MLFVLLAAEVRFPLLLLLLPKRVVLFPERIAFVGIVVDTVARTAVDIVLDTAVGTAVGIVLGIADTLNRQFPLLTGEVVGSDRFPAQTVLPAAAVRRAAVGLDTDRGRTDRWAAAVLQAVCVLRIRLESSSLLRRTGFAAWAPEVPFGLLAYAEGLPPKSSRSLLRN